MAAGFIYLMEHDQESERLDRKTDIALVHKQARWAGLKPGMAVADIGCGSGKTSHALFQAAAPNGSVLGLDGSEQRIAFAKQNYSVSGLDYVCRDVYESLSDLGRFDFIWVRFFLEYHRRHAFELVHKFTDLLNPGGIMCLIDLDHNCLNHYELPPRIDAVLRRVVELSEIDGDFDTRMGIKLYSFLYDLGFENIDVTVEPHHLIFGPLDELNDYNWNKKLEVAVRQSGCSFDDFEGGFTGFQKEFQDFFSNPRRFTYTPVIACRGVKAS